LAMTQPGVQEIISQLGRSVLPGFLATWRRSVLRRCEGKALNRKGRQGKTRKGREEDRWSEVALVDDLC
jgi:hypothetical protein